MKSLFFSKYQGNGNDFVLIDDRKERFPIENKVVIQNICHRNLGIGADGIILLSPSEKHDARMIVLNSDGSQADSCGNGLCCLTRFMCDIGYKKESFSIETRKGIVLSNINDNKVVLEVPDPQILGENIPIIIEDQKFQCFYIDSGVPHAVCFVKCVEGIDVKTIGRKLRNHSYFQPLGANVDFAEVDKDFTVKVRTYERGVEDETCSCGTGAVAVAIASSLKFNLQSPVLIKFKHGSMEVSFNTNQGVISHVKLKNHINYVYSGVFPLKKIH